MPPPADIVKVAIEWPGAYPKLMEIDQVSKAGSSVGLFAVFCFGVFTDFGWFFLPPPRPSLPGCVEKSVQ